MQPGSRSRTYVALAAAAAVAIATTAAPVSLRAEMVTTDQVIAETHSASERERVQRFLDRDDVAQQLAQLGVDVDETQARVAALSDAEVARIAGQLDTLPAGEGVGTLIALAGLVFLVLLITDFVGATDVFTFVR